MNGMHEMSSRAVPHKRDERVVCMCVCVCMFTFRSSFHNALTRYIHSVRRPIERKELIDSMREFSLPSSQDGKVSEKIYLCIYSSWWNNYDGQKEY